MKVQILKKKIRYCLAIKLLKKNTLQKNLLDQKRVKNRLININTCLNSRIILNQTFIKIYPTLHIRQ